MLNELLFIEQQTVVEQNNIIGNVLQIPLIEIEQTNPRANKINGVMKARYYNTGGDADDPESVVEYEYEYVGGEISFIKNPMPRPSIGTGKVAWLCDDERDPMGKAIAVPEGALSGSDFGWNKELLASHYGEGHWRIVDPLIDIEVRERYRNILVNKELPEDEVDALVAAAVELQEKGVRGKQKIVVRTTANQVVKERMVGLGTQKAEIENHPIVEALKKQNQELAEKMAKLVEKTKGKRKYKRRTTRKRVVPKPVEAEPVTTGNLGG